MRSIYILIVLVFLNSSCEKCSEKPPEEAASGGCSSKRSIKPDKDTILRLSLTKDGELAIGVHNYFSDDKKYEAAIAWLMIANKLSKQDDYEARIEAYEKSIKSQNEDDIDPEKHANYYIFKEQKSEEDYYKAVYWVSVCLKNGNANFSVDDLNENLAISLLQYLPDAVDMSDVEDLFK